MLDVMGQVETRVAFQPCAESNQPAFGLIDFEVDCREHFLEPLFAANQRRLFHKQPMVVLVANHACQSPGIILVLP